MIEVLVTMVVLSIGLLGMATLQITGIRSTNSSTFRTQATLLANDIVERMRSNPAAVTANLFMDVDSAVNINCNELPVPYCGEYYDGAAIAGGEACNSSQMATFDINEWFCGVASAGARQGGVQNSLPQGAAAIACVDTDPPSGADADLCTDRSPHTVTISWTESNPHKGGAATITQTISMMVQP